MSNFTITKLVDKINSRREVWEMEGPILLEYLFCDPMTNTHKTFLTIRIGQHLGLFSIDCNKITLAIGVMHGGLANPRRVWFIDAVARTLLSGILVKYISPVRTSVPPYMLFPSVCREFFDSLAFDLNLSKGEVDLTILDVNQPDRVSDTNYKL